MKRLNTWMPVLGLLAVAGLTGCTIKGSDGGVSVIKTEGAPAPAARPAETRPAERAAAPSSSTVYYPSGRADGAVLRLDRLCPSEVTAGQPFEYEIKVTNVAPVPLLDVKVTEATVTNFKMTDSTVARTAGPDGSSVYNLGNMGAGESRSIKVRGSVANEGTFASCATASYVLAACCEVKVTAPALKITKSAPAEASLCDTIPVQIVVTNTGTGTARNVVVRDALQGGLTTADGKNAYEMNVGNLAGGESRTLNFTAKAPKTGSYTNVASVTAEGNMKADSNSTTTAVKNCNLQITKTGPANLYIGRDATYTITVRNTGDGVARNTVVEDAVPAGTSFRSATEGGAMATGSVRWNLGDLAPGASKTMTVTLNSGNVSEIRNSATVSSLCCTAQTANAVTAVAGVPAIVVELVDNPDPIEVNGETTFTIVITNQGNRADSNLKPVFTLASGLAFVSGNGDSAVTNNGQTVTLGTVANLAPKQTVRWTIKAKNTAANGDSRSNLSVTTDFFKTPITEIESTNLVR